jgi:hypothetical protein
VAQQEQQQKQQATGAKLRLERDRSSPRRARRRKNTGWLSSQAKQANQHAPLIFCAAENELQSGPL